jgi:hypothetical protein
MWQEVLETIVIFGSIRCESVARMECIFGSAYLNWRHECDVSPAIE